VSRPHGRMDAPGRGRRGDSRHLPRPFPYPGESGGPHPPSPFSPQKTATGLPLKSSTAS